MIVTNPILFFVLCVFARNFFISNVNQSQERQGQGRICILHCVYDLICSAKPTTQRNQRYLVCLSSFIVLITGDGKKEQENWCVLVVHASTRVCPDRCLRAEAEEAGAGKSAKDSKDEKVRVLLLHSHIQRCSRHGQGWYFCCGIGTGNGCGVFCALLLSL